MNYAALMQMLLAHPKTFLKAHYLKISVQGNQAFGPFQFYFGGKLDNTHAHLPVPVRQKAWFGKGSKVLAFVPAALRFQLAPGDGGIAQNNIPGTWVYPVPVVHAGTVPNYAQLAGDLLPYNGHVLMVTTLLNGCTFCGSTPNGVLMKHIKPDGTRNHAQLAQHVSAVGAFNDPQAGALFMFGSGGFGYDEGNEDVTIVGVRVGNVWKVYAQVHHRQANTIKRVEKFFEG